MKLVLKLHLGIESSPSENHVEASSNDLHYNDNKFELSKSAWNPFKFLKDLFSRGAKEKQAAVDETSARNVDTPDAADAGSARNVDIPDAEDAGSARNVDTPDTEDAGSSCYSATSSESKETISSNDPEDGDKDDYQITAFQRKISESAPFDYLPFDETEQHSNNSNSRGNSQKNFVDSDGADVIQHSESRLLGKREMLRDYPSGDRLSGTVPHCYQEYSRTERLQVK